MRDLWRALALLWLGGVASPSLADDPDDANGAVESGAPAIAPRHGGTKAAPRDAAEAVADAARAQETPR